MHCQDWLLWMSGVVIRPFWPTRKQTSETDYLASSVVAHVEAGTCGIASEEDTGSRVAEGWMSMSSTHAERRKPSPRASAAVQRDVRVMKPDKIVL